MKEKINMNTRTFPSLARFPSIALVLLFIVCIPMRTHAQSSPFPAGYINYNDTICYNYGDLYYLIITADSLRPAFKDFAMSKALKGYNVKIAAVEDIYQTYSNIADSVERIKWFIANEYMQREKSVQFVLLGGDVNIVPTRFVAPRSSQYSKNNQVAEAFDYISKYDSLKLTACDLYYVSFYKSFNWDDGNNGKYAETEEIINLNGIDYYIDDDHVAPRQYINISRLPVFNSDDVKNYIAKLFRYERGELKNPASYNRALFAGCKAFCDKNGVSDTKYWNDSIINNYLTNRTVTTLYDNSFTKINLRSRLASIIGFNLINIDTHGTETGWRMVDSVTFYNTSMAELQIGNTASIITTTACDVGDFSASLSLGKSIILNAKNNTIAFWGATNDGFGPRPSEYSTKPGSSRELIGNF